MERNSHTRRRTLKLGATGVCSLTLAGCLGTSGGDDTGEGGEATPMNESTVTTTTTDGKSAGVHDIPYSVTIKIVAENVSKEDVPIDDPPKIDQTGLNEQKRSLLRGLIDDGTVRWRGKSDEEPPQHIRKLAEVVATLPPKDSPEVGRDEKKGYVVFKRSTYRLRWVYIAP